MVWWYDGMMLMCILRGQWPFGIMHVMLILKKVKCLYINKYKYIDKYFMLVRTLY